MFYTARLACLAHERHGPIINAGPYDRTIIQSANRITAAHSL
jgi:hypothetical protein